MLWIVESNKLKRVTNLKDLTRVKTDKENKQ